MNWIKATNDQLKVIIGNDGECPSPLLYGALEEATRRNLYKPYLLKVLISRFKSIPYLENLTKLTIDEILNLCYEKAFDAIKFHKPGNGYFLSFWKRFIHNALNDVIERNQRKKRTAEMISLNEEEIQIVDDFNTERKAINRVILESLLSQLPREEQYIVLKYNAFYTFREIGKDIGRSRDYARLKYYAAIEKLKSIGA
jgi:RNA polymerase sigma factor (sigma-70 family)